MSASRQADAPGRRERIRLLIELGRPKEALKLVYQARAAGDLGAELAELEGLALIRLDDPQGAARAIAEGLRIAPERAHLHYLNAFAARGLGDLVATGRHLLEALRLAAEEPVYLRAHAELLSEQKQHQEAVAQAKLAVHHGADRGQNHVTLGFVLSAAGDKKGARESYQKALSLDPDDATAWNNLGCLDLEAGDTPTARERFREALRLAPEGERARKNLQQTLLGRTEEGFVRWDDWVKGFAQELAAVDEPLLLLALAFEAEEAQPVLWAALKVPGRARAFAALAGVSLYTVLALLRLGGMARLVGGSIGLAASFGGKRWLTEQRRTIRTKLKTTRATFERTRTDWLEGRLSRAGRDVAARRLIERTVVELLDRGTEEKV